jgi:hypothetical protein
VVTEEFMQQHGIDLVVHGFANDTDAEKQRDFFAMPIQMGKFLRISYYSELSTTGIIDKIQLAAEETPTPSKPQWFGATLAAATNNASIIPFDPFPFSLRQAIEPHIAKARKRREEALAAIREATGPLTFDEILSEFKAALGVERDFCYDTTIHDVRSALLCSADLPVDTDLTLLHMSKDQKYRLLSRLTQQPTIFQDIYDRFVRDVCAPIVASRIVCDEIYYQAFPCVRIVQPDEFSIGPHADASYGHHPCSVNFYVPLTQIGGSSSLFVESRHGSEDWHPIEASYGTMRQQWQPGLTSDAHPFLSLNMQGPSSTLQVLFVRTGRPRTRQA